MVRSYNERLVRRSVVTGIVDGVESVVVAAGILRGFLPAVARNLRGGYLLHQQGRTASEGNFKDGFRG